MSFKGVGRIRVRVRGVDSAGIERIQTALREFYAANNLAALRAIKEGTLSPQQALEIFRTQGANSIVRGGMFEQLGPALWEWLENHSIAAATRKSYRDHLRQLGTVISQTHFVSDLPSVLRDFRQRCQKRESYRVFNVARAICCSFAGSTLGKHSPLYQELFAVQPLKTPKTMKRRRTVGLEVADVVLLTSLMKPRHAEHVWSMCLTGMRRNEFFGIHCPPWEWSDSPPAIRVQGGKTENASRTILRMRAVRKPKLKSLAVERAIRIARKHPLLSGLPPIHLHAFRYSFRVWCEKAGIHPLHVEMYGGWSGDSSMMARYGRLEVLSYVEEDRNLLEAYIIAEKEKLAGARGAPELIRKIRDEVRPEPVFHMDLPMRARPSEGA